MLTLSSENFLSRILAYGAAFTTIFLINESVTDPVNAPKMVAIGCVGFSAFAVILGSSLVSRLRNDVFVLSLLALFVLAMLNSMISSNAPLTQNLYGVYGRNNGLLTYLFLILILISALVIRDLDNFEKVTRALFLAGIVNVAYCLWVILFGDFLDWSNPYGNILGTFGNPNFIGAFLGILFSAGFALLLDKKTNKKFKVLLLILLPICAFEIIKSHAIQGRVVASFGCTIVGFLFIRSKCSQIIQVGYSATAIIAGGFALAGALQHGPLTQFIYKTSVSLRGQYWLAGWNTGSSHPWTGVGMDTFGDWYRRARDIRAMELPGPNVVVNAAHNVPMDMFAFGGWPLLVCYLLIMGTAGYSAFKVLRRQKNFDVDFVILATAWAGYQLQSVISINQIGLAVWGWLLSGVLIAYERSTREKLDHNNPRASDERRIRRKSTQILPAQIPICAFIGMLIGLSISLPPLISDIKWRSAQRAQTLQTLESSLKQSYFNPQNSMKFATNIQSLAQSNLGELSRKYAIEGVQWNPDSYDLWKLLYLIPSSTPTEKEQALKNMKRLDPLNPDVISTQ